MTKTEKINRQRIAKFKARLFQMQREGYEFYVDYRGNKWVNDWVYYQVKQLNISYYTVKDFALIQEKANFWSVRIDYFAAPVYLSAKLDEHFSLKLIAEKRREIN